MINQKLPKHKFTKNLHLNPGDAIYLGYCRMVDMHITRTIDVSINSLYSMSIYSNRQIIVYVESSTDEVNWNCFHCFVIGQNDTMTLHYNAPTEFIRVRAQTHNGYVETEFNVIIKRCNGI